METERQRDRDKEKQREHVEQAYPLYKFKAL